MPTQRKTTGCQNYCNNSATNSSVLHFCRKTNLNRVKFTTNKKLSMGSLCSSCFGNGGESTNLMPSPETRRRQQLEAAERRRQESEHRGIKNPESVRRQQQRAEEMERREQEAARTGGSGPALKWQTD